MKRVDCIGMVGKFPTPKGLLMFWDTGRTIAPVQLAELLALQHSVFNATGETRKEAWGKVASLMREVAHQANVYPTGQAAVADDGRILVTEPWFSEKEPAKD